LGHFRGKEGQSILRFIRHGLTSLPDLSVLLPHIALNQISQNSYYGLYDGKIQEGVPQLFTVWVIYPCAQDHIEKYSEQESILFKETYSFYLQFTKPWIDSRSLVKLEWLYNMLNKTAEQEKLLLEDSDPLNGFLLYAYKEANLALKGDIKEFMGLVLCNRKDLKTIRDLNRETLPLLYNIKNKVTQFLDHKLSKPGQRLNPSSQFRIFLHYKPTYFSLHVHISHLDQERKIKDHELNDVIENIELLPNYYQTKILTYQLGMEDNLFKENQSKVLSIINHKNEAAI